ncbi:sugar transferase [Vibrio parahaemolyticus]|nr:sugar transferase [Vibrio parahaemolyticus]MDN4713053.1 sugar transferase [Vibrio parahaemolyticus]MDN4716985.1 sugar transferase [Vibrio parahaemolyticus]MDN4722331.1 sugar transferase [Vibrio parahaemolyticus]MDN4724409.1 sugar transferase [Vibrio parahaemolyticus]
MAQATVRSNTTPEERTRLDLEYVKTHSIYLDLKIIAMTVKQVIRKGGN